MTSRRLAEPTITRPTTSDTSAPVRAMESRDRKVRRRCAFACRSESKPHASTAMDHFHSFGYVPGSIRTRPVSAAAPDFAMTISSVVMRAFDSATASPRTKSDRKSTRLNSSHGYISYAVFCLKKKKKNKHKRSDKDSCNHT